MLIGQMTACQGKLYDNLTNPPGAIPVPRDRGKALAGETTINWIR